MPHRGRDARYRISRSRFLAISIPVAKSSDGGVDAPGAFNMRGVKSLPPLDMWTNVRIFSQDDEWFSDGYCRNGNLDLPDMEAVAGVTCTHRAISKIFLRHARGILLARGRGRFCQRRHVPDGPATISWSAIELHELHFRDRQRPTIRGCRDRFDTARISARPRGRRFRRRFEGDAGRTMMRREKFSRRS